MDKKVLLIADDEEMNRKIISRFLKNDYEILQAADGRAAMELLHSTHVDALLLDIIMPEMDGLEVLEQMQQEDSLSHIGVLVATSTKEKTERSALSLGADDVVSKPYDPIVIRKRMQNILAVKQSDQYKEQLQGADDLKRSRNEVISTEVEPAVEQIVKYTDIINASRDNMDLVMEVVASIREKAEQIQKVLQGND